MLAVFKGQDELFDELIAAGADPQRGGNWTPLHYAATEGRTEFIERLLKAGASANIQTSSGVTPLIMAARKPSRAAVTMLLKAGAYRDYCTDTGQSPADFARRAGDKELAEYLAIPKYAVKGPHHTGSGQVTLHAGIWTAPAPTALELLAPARDADAGIAAIDHGADAVYIGGPAFGARGSGRQFTRRHCPTDRLCPPLQRSGISCAQHALYE